MSRTQTWKISDELWSEVEPLIPTQEELLKQPRKNTSARREQVASVNTTTGRILKRSFTFCGLVSFGMQFLANCSAVSVRQRCTTVFSVGQKRASLNEFGRQVCAKTTS